MKKRMLMLLVSLFALAPAVLGNAFAAEERSIQSDLYAPGGKQDCEFKGIKRISAVKKTAEPKHEKTDAVRSK